jgi:hypothetical protein
VATEEFETRDTGVHPGALADPQSRVASGNPVYWELGQRCTLFSQSRSITYKVALVHIILLQVIAQPGSATGYPHRARTSIITPGYP